MISSPQGKGKDDPTGKVQDDFNRAPRIPRSRIPTRSESSVGRGRIQVRDLDLDLVRYS